jgi:hypothetical protein
MCRCEGNQDKCDNADADSHSAAQIDSSDSSDDEEDVVQYVFPYQSSCSESLLAYNAYDIQEEQVENEVQLDDLEIEMDVDSSFGV